MNIIPKPLKIEFTGETFSANSVFLHSDCAYSEFLKENFNIPVSLKETGICLLTKQDTKGISEKLPENCTKDAYILEIRKDSITLCFSEYSGFMNGISTVSQILSDILMCGGSALIKCGKIYDASKYAYRGLLIDSARHFIPVSELKKTIKMMALYKLNYLHLHLTDDQGWRIEIKKYPLLTENGSVRGETQLTLSGRTDGREYGDGLFYTQNELLELVAFAEKYGVEIIPEIDMPGHLLGAISQYPYLSCAEKEVTVRTRWGVEKVIACAAKEESFQFLFDILDEVTALFPCKYFHIGGDEVPKDEWKKCPKCQNKMKELGLKNENEIQGWFENRIIDYLEAKGKEVLIWDENLGVSPVSKKTVLQLWRNELNRAQSLEWVKNGGRMLISYGKHFYFDYPYGKTPLKMTYGFKPKNIKLKENDMDYVLGQEAAVWTEWIRDTDKFEFMLYPRMQAFSENCWAENTGDYNNFEQRLKPHLEFLEQNGIMFCPLSLCNPKGFTGLKQKFFTKNRFDDTYSEFKMRKEII